MWTPRLVPSPLRSLTMEFPDAISWLEHGPPGPQIPRQRSQDRRVHSPIGVFLHEPAPNAVGTTTAISIHVLHELHHSIFVIPNREEKGRGRSGRWL